MDTAGMMCSVGRTVMLSGFLRVVDCMMYSEWVVKFHGGIGANGIVGF